MFAKNKAEMIHDAIGKATVLEQKLADEGIVTQLKDGTYIPTAKGFRHSRNVNRNKGKRKQKRGGKRKKKR